MKKINTNTNRRCHNSYSESMTNKLLILILSILICVIIPMTGCGSKNTDDDNTTTAATEHPVETEPETENISVELPDLTGISKEDAVKELAELGVTAAFSEITTDSVKDGYVFSHVPTAGKTVHEGDEVTLYIAKNPPTEKSTSAPTSGGSSSSGSSSSGSSSGSSSSGSSSGSSSSSSSSGSSSLSPKTYGGNLLYCSADDYVSLREGPDVNTTELTRIPHGEMMGYLYTKTGHWYYVQYGSLKGYVYDAYVTFDRYAVR